MKILQRLGMFISCCYLLVACNSFQLVTESTQKAALEEFNPILTTAERQAWHFRDLKVDSIPGSSIDKAHHFVKDKQGKTIIVAVIDSELDIAQKELKNQIWINTDEIPNNGIDDDNNGYIDDIHGWNYVGSIEESSRSKYYSHFEYVRLIKKYDSLFKNITSLKDVPEHQKKDFLLYQKAYLIYNEKLQKTQKNLENFEIGRKRFISGVEVLTKYLPKVEEPYVVSQLDSLKETLKVEEEIEKLQQLISYKKYKHSLKSMRNQIRLYRETIDYQLNFDFDERSLTNDNSNDLNDFPYGNNDIQGFKVFSHSTKISSIIASEINDTLVEGINDKVKIMPLSIAVAGSEHDKDTALAIRYAVDNGAKVINMSIGKDFSLHPEWVYDALEYAASNDVVIVTSSGNDGYNLDKIENYPNDTRDGIEFVNNFIKVGNTSNKLDDKLIRSSSNYGKREVDIFAPGTKIPCLTRSGKKVDRGTSLSSAVVSGIASLLFSYYPNLTAAEVKEIILASGTSIDLMVLKPYASGEKRDPNKVPFSSLSKSGKIVNAYNALLMADEISALKEGE